MEGVHFEKKQLVAQWKSSLVAIQKWAGLEGADAGAGAGAAWVRQCGRGSQEA